MTDTDTYLRELRRALPLGYRRRLVAEVREHFDSAATAGAAEALTIERLGPPRAVADQLLADLRSGALGPAARLSAALTATRLAVAAVLAVAVAAGVGVTKVRSSSSSPPSRTVQRVPEQGVVRNGVTVRRLILTLARSRERITVHTLPGGYVVPVRIRPTQAP